MRLRRLATGTWQVLAICSDRGDCPVESFLAAQRGKLADQAQRMWALFDVVAADGPPRSTGISHKVAAEIWELIRGDLRVLWFYDQGRAVICSHGFLKQTQKTPASHIHLAEANLARYRAAQRAGSLSIVEEDEE